MPSSLKVLMVLMFGVTQVAAAAEVGSVSFVIGRVQVVDASGHVRAVAAGDPIHVGDTCVTAAGEHVHLRFVDGGFVSVRPGSSLQIEEYDTRTENTAIRFKLDHGVARSITGQAAQARKERFRLNTPVAAIGVRGTDFVVQADAEKMRAVVNQGAIVVAPLAGTCTQQSLGPCVTADARELTDDMGRVILELNARRPPQIRTLEGGGPDQAAPPVPQEPVPGQAFIAAVETVAVEHATVPVIGVAEAAQQPSPSAQLPAKLYWGRWMSGARQGDTHSVDYDTANAKGIITVGDRYAGLFRTPGESPVLSMQLGQGTFSLLSGEVSLVSASGATSPGTIENGWLKIDFAQRSFSTALTLSHPATGAVGLESAGAVRDDGVFAVRQGDTRVAGAVSLDGKEAGYLFDKVLGQGALTGTTLWTR